MQSTMLFNRNESHDGQIQELFLSTTLINITKQWDFHFPFLTWVRTELLLARIIRTSTWGLFFIQGGLLTTWNDEKWNIFKLCFIIRNIHHVSGYLLILDQCELWQQIVSEWVSERAVRDLLCQKPLIRSPFPLKGWHLSPPHVGKKWTKAEIWGVEGQ